MAFGIQPKLKINGEHNEKNINVHGCGFGGYFGIGRLQQDKQPCGTDAPAHAERAGDGGGGGHADGGAGDADRGRAHADSHGNVNCLAERYTDGPGNMHHGSQRKRNSYHDRDVCNRVGHSGKRQRAV